MIVVIAELSIYRVFFDFLIAYETQNSSQFTLTHEFKMIEENGIRRARTVTQTHRATQTQTHSHQSNRIEYCHNFCFYQFMNIYQR